ncbi:hypothetical protein [Bacteroides heparinolyticus]|uniref:hypothetical protein n=1 Tax=Prevotella heparinolytica TaxID=28113 RepID=UPI00359FACBE
MNKLNQNSMIQELDIKEQESVNGGGLLAAVLVGAAVTMIVEYWPDIKQAASDAWNGK